MERGKQRGLSPELRGVHRLGGKNQQEDGGVARETEGEAAGAGAEEPSKDKTSDV